jgi:hypothetical protein
MMADMVYLGFSARKTADSLAAALQDAYFLYRRNGLFT